MKTSNLIKIALVATMAAFLFNFLQRAADAQTDNYSSLPVTFASPAVGAVAVTPSDSVNLSKISRGLYIGGGGNVSVEFVDGTVATFVGVGSGGGLGVRVVKVRATGTTATNIINMY